jgi:hypothetical protein
MTPETEMAIVDWDRDNVNDGTRRHRRTSSEQVGADAELSIATARLIRCPAARRSVRFDQLPQLRLVEHRDTERFGLLQFRSGLAARKQIVGVARNAARDFGPQRL